MESRVLWVLWVCVAAAWCEDGGHDGNVFVTGDIVEAAAQHEESRVPSVVPLTFGGGDSHGPFFPPVGMLPVANGGGAGTPYIIGETLYASNMFSAGNKIYRPAPIRHEDRYWERKGKR